MVGLIKDNYDFFKNEIIGYKYIFTLYDNRSIIVRVDETNLAHLIGLKHCSFMDKASMSGQLFFNTFEEKKNYDLYDFIDKFKDEKNELNKDEIFFKQKNDNFIPIFNSLIIDKEINLRIYKAINDKDKFSTDYLYVKVFKNGISNFGYIGIVGESHTDYHRFNSIIFDSGEKKADSIELYVKSFERIKDSDFDEKKYKFVKSKHTETKTKKKNPKKKKYSLNKKDLNFINKKINKYILKKGPNGKANYILIDTNGNIVEKYFEKVRDWKSKDEIIDFIIKLP